MKQERLPSPESLVREIADLAETSEKLAKAYKALYTASLRPDGGGSLGQIGGKGASASDPTASTAMSPTKQQLRYAAMAIVREVHKAQAAVDRAEERGWRVFQELPGGAYREDFERRRQERRKWRVHTWTTLPCRCSRDDHGWWVVRQSCAEHVAMIPLAERTPFLAIPGPGHEFGPFKPKTEAKEAAS